MSRIDEALKLMSPRPILARSATRVAEVPEPVADDLTMDQYPWEGRTSQAMRHTAGRNETAPPALDDFQPTVVTDEPQRSVKKHGLESDSKLMISGRRSAVSLEQYRRLAATLCEAQTERGLKTVMVTSAVPREGKTLTAINLALTLSNSYARRVLLIDGDLRRPSVHEVLGISARKGLSDVLRGSRSGLPVVELSPLLSVLPSGPPDQNPQAGLSSERMRTLLDAASKRFDWVILDTPPVALLSDAQIVSRLTQATVVVIRAGFTPFSLVEKAIAELGRECIIGTVLNGVEQNAIPATGYYRDYYGHE
jgi:protein-tyrosine kinase